MPRSLVTTLVAAALAYAAFAAFVYFTQRSLIYFPHPRLDGGAPATIELTTAAGAVLVTVRPRQASARALIYFGGNAENVAWSLPELEAALPDHALYLMHYRGYGGSAGAPSEDALVADALALFDRVQAAHREVAAVGRSLGSGVAVQLASRRPVARLVLVTPYASLESLAASLYWFLPVRWMLHDKFDSARHAAQVNAPTLLIAAEHDEVIPRASTLALHAAFRPGVARLEVVAGAGHNTIGERPAYRALLARGVASP